jgi:hypothetical protein
VERPSETPYFVDFRAYRLNLAAIFDVEAAETKTMELTVFVMEPYVPNGGTFMAYHLAKLLCENYGFNGVAVGHTMPDHGIMSYHRQFPLISPDLLPQEIGLHDVLIANPSFSNFHLGLKCRGRKLMYVQGFNTFALIDRRFNHYVAVSGVVQRLLSGVYDIDAPIIPPFIDTSDFSSGPLWADRKRGSILVSAKSPAIYIERILTIFRTKGFPLDITSSPSGKIPRAEWARLVGKHQYFLTLSPAEGFGLMPLEAMASGTVVMGFDGYGGRDYMRSGVNCAVVPYCDIEGLAERMIEALSDRNYAERLSAAGQLTASDPVYSYNNFCFSWRREIEVFLSKNP